LDIVPLKFCLKTSETKGKEDFKLQVVKDKIPHGMLWLYKWVPYGIL